MASPGNPNPPQQQQPGGPSFDMHKLFKPSAPILNTSPSFPSPSPSSSASPPPYLTPSASYPPPTGPYPLHYLPPYLPQDHQHHQQQQFMAAANMHLPRPISYPSPPSPNPNAGGARLMALLGTQTPQPPPPNLDFSQPSLPFPSNSPLPSAGSSDFMVPAIPLAAASNSAAPQRSPSRLLSTKLPKGRHLVGDRVAYDLDVRLPGEVQPQLEVTPITKYGSDPGLFVGRQIAVNRTYICYGLKLGNIRVLNIDTASRSLLRGHTQRVTDMAFFAEDVHFLASVSVDGRLFIWKISEGADEEEKPQITGKIIIAIQIIGVGEAVHPRVSWHPHKQEILMVAIGNRILKIDTIKAGKGGGFSAEEPLKCPIDKLIDGVQFVGKHEGEITELSMCQWMTSRLASASTDGTVMIWEDRKTGPAAVLRPHGGEPVNSVTFLTAPHRPDHIVLITAGYLNREVKIWTSASEEGWLLPGEAETWQCTQTLELKSSGEARIEDAFFNQVVALPRAGLFLLANAKKNAIYAVHIEYGNYPAATRMDYIAEFTVTMPILSLTGTSDSLPDGEHVIQVYCVQTQAIQQYALNLSQCLPPPLGNLEFEKTESNVSRAFDATNSDGSATQEPSQLGKSTEMLVGSATSIPRTLSSSSECAPVNLASEVTGLPQFATPSIEIKTTPLPSLSNAENITTASPALPSSPLLSRKSSGFRTPSISFEPSSPLAAHSGDQPVHDFSVDLNKDHLKENMPDVPSSSDILKKDDTSLAQNDDTLVVPNSPVTFRHPTHLVTPSEILSTAASSSEISQTSQGISAGEKKIQDAGVNNDAKSAELEVKIVGETRSGQDIEFVSQRESHIAIPEKKEKAFYSQASDLGIQMARESVEAIRQTDLLANNVSVAEVQGRLASTGEEVQETTKDVPSKVGELETSTEVQQSPVPATKGKRQKWKNSQVSGPSSLSPTPFDSTDSSNEPSSISGTLATDGSSSQLMAMQEMLEQLMSMQKEMQKQMNVIVSVPVTKEGRRLEASLGRNVEKVVKANADALWARFLEENAKHEKLERDRAQQITNLISNCINKDLPSMLEKTVKKEIAAVGSAVARAITPIVEKSISSAVTESFQKGVGDKAVNQLEKSVASKLEATVARQIQTQFQTSGKQALQDALRSSLEASVVPAFEMSCKAMFEQVDATFQKGLLKHTTASQQQLESTLSPLAVTLRDTINSASSISKTLSGDLAEGQRKILAFAAGANINSMVQDNGSLPGLHDKPPEAPLDPTKELSRLIAERKFEEAFTGALHRSDVSIVSWLCSQVDLQGLLSMVPLPLSQGVLLALLQQLACDISNDTSRKLQWMTDAAVVINPADPTIVVHVRPIFEQVYQILNHQRNLPTTSAPEANSIRLLMHVINSVLMTCK